MKQVLFRVDAGSNIGLGHLMRCLALAQRLVEKGIAVTFAVLPDSLPFCQSRDDWVGGVYVISEEEACDNGEQLKSYINSRRFDWVILDGYQFTDVFRKVLSTSCAQLAVFDDENNSGQLYADIVINGSSQQVVDGYKKTAPLAKLCVGQGYRVLRSEFIQLLPNPWGKRPFLTIMFGGSDPFNITIPLLLALDELNNDSAGTVFPPIKVLTGAAYPRLQELLHTLSNLTLDVEHIHDCHKVSSILNDSQLVISAAGGTQFELLACHTPAILVIVAENQRPATLEAQSQGWCCVVDNDIEAVLQISCLARSLCDTPNILINMHRNAKAYSDTKGAERIINMMRL